MASTSSSGHAEYEGNIDNLAGHGDQLVGSSSERIEEIPCVTVSTTVMEPRIKLQILATWLLGFWQYTCGVLGYLIPCLPSMQVSEREEADETTIGLNDQLNVWNDGSDDAESEYVLESKHKVFLSHSGAQKDFVEQLCVDLERCDRYPFFDKLRSSLPTGEKFPKLIFDAIKQCQVGVLVLSEDFFMRSKWPMLELNAMVKEFEKPNSSMKIIPVFYKISVNALKDPKNHVRWTSQWVKWAHNDRDKRIDVEEWKRVLRVIGSINGMVSKEGVSDVKFREAVVEEVCGLVCSEIRWDDSHVQGRSRICKVIWKKMELMSMESKISIMGLYGMGGIGKTTICKALCNELSQRFNEKVCHIELESASAIEMLRKALKKLTYKRHDILDEVDDIRQGFSYLKQSMLNQAIFLALDNVQDNHRSIEEARLYLKGHYGVGSVLLVTTRSLEVLKSLGLDERNCMEMPEMEEDEAKALFLYHVDLPCGNEVDEVLIKDCIKRCHFLKSNGNSKHYHPLALRVLGQQLGCNPTQWREELKKIDSFNQLGDMEHPIFSILRNSFDSLNHEYQLIFMDLALMVPFYEEWIDEYSKVTWLCMIYEESCKDMVNMLEVLKRRSLLDDLSGGFTKIGMHDLWYEFAIWKTKIQDLNAQQWVYKVDGKRGALEKRGQWRESVERMCFSNWGWKSLNGLKLYDFVNVTAFRLYIAIVMSDRALDLDLSGLKQLKSLDIRTPGMTIRVDGLSSLTNLGRLAFGSPGSLVCLNEIGHLTNLQILWLQHCGSDEVLDLANLTLLEVVGLLECPVLITIRGLSSKLTNLCALYITNCKSLQECPGLDELTALEVLHLRRCGQLEELPYLGWLTKLRRLVIQECTSLRTIPDLEGSDFVALKEFQVVGCSKLATMTRPTNLQVLDMVELCVQRVPSSNRGSHALERLCVPFWNVLRKQLDFSRFSALKVVEIHGWNGPIWSSIRHLLMLEVLRLYDCKGEDGDIFDLQHLKRLQFVYLARCEFKNLSGLSNLTTLENLAIYNCGKLETLPAFDRLTKLSSLGVTGCNNVRDWPSAANLCSLAFLSVDDVLLRKIVFDLENLTLLRELELCGPRCENVFSTVESKFSQLETLRIFEFSTMEAFDVSNFSKMGQLQLHACSNLRRVICNIPQTALYELAVMGSENLVEIPDLSVFPHLEELSLGNCRSLRRVTSRGPSTSMKMIRLVGCDRQIELPDLSRLRDFQLFRIDDDDWQGEEVDDKDDYDDDGIEDSDGDHQVEEVEEMADDS